MTTAGEFRRRRCRIRSGVTRSRRNCIFDTLEEEVVPLYYERDGAGFFARVGAAQQTRHEHRDPALQ